MINGSSKCTCGHQFNAHDAGAVNKPCLMDWYGHVPGCDCSKFVIDNLSIVEEAYDKKQSSI